MKTIKIAGVPEHFNLPWHLCIDNGEFEYVPDFVKLAESYGAKGMRVTKESDIAKAFKFADKNEKAPTVLEFVIPTEINVLPMVPAGKSLSEMLLKDKD